MLSRPGKGSLALLGSWMLLGMPSWPQDVFLGGGLDFAVATGSHTTFEWERGTQVNFHFILEDRAEVYYEYNLAGGHGRTSAFNVRFPRLRPKHLDLSLGRLPLPFGLPQVDPTRRYVPGAPDWFDTFRLYRPGNVFLDHFGDGLQVTYQGPRWQVEAAVINAPDVGAQDVAGRWTLQEERGTWRGGLSAFSGEVKGNHHLTWFGPHLSLTLKPSVEVGLEALWGRIAGKDQRAFYAELYHRWRHRQPPSWTAFVSRAGFDSEGEPSVSITHLGVQRQMDPFGQVELRYEVREAPGRAGENRIVARYRADF